MAPGLGSRCGTGNRGAELTLVGLARRGREDTRAAWGGGFPAHCSRRGPGPELANVCACEVVWPLVMWHPHLPARMNG